MLSEDKILRPISEEMWDTLVVIESTHVRTIGDTPPHMCILGVAPAKDLPDAFIVSRTPFEDIERADPSEWPALFAYRMAQSELPGVAYGFLGLIIEQDQGPDVYMTLLFSKEGRAVCGLVQSLQTRHFAPYPLEDLDLAFPFSLYQPDFDITTQH